MTDVTYYAMPVSGGCGRGETLTLFHNIAGVKGALSRYLATLIKSVFTSVEFQN